MTDEHKAIIRQSIAHYRQFAEALPRDRDGELLIKEAASYFDDDLVRIWMNCQDAVKESEDPKITRREILEGMVESLRCLPMRKLTSILPRRFVVMYAEMRKEGMSHREAVKTIVNRRLMSD